MLDIALFLCIDSSSNFLFYEGFCKKQVVAGLCKKRSGRDGSVLGGMKLLLTVTGEDNCFHTFVKFSLLKAFLTMCFLPASVLRPSEKIGALDGSVLGG